MDIKEQIKQLELEGWLPYEPKAILVMEGNMDYKTYHLYRRVGNIVEIKAIIDLPIREGTAPPEL